MSQIAVEAYLAKLYTDADARTVFLADPMRAARMAGLSDEEAKSLCTIDRAGLKMAAASYAHKRDLHRRHKRTLVELLKEWLPKRPPRVQRTRN